jgi:hypothetical protein
MKTLFWEEWKMKKLLLFTVLCLAMTVSAQAQLPLKVDFNSTTQDGGPHPQAGYESYDAGHEVAADFNTKTYGSITVTPTWSNTTDNRVMQMIDRGASHDANWDNTAGDLDLTTDWIGIDTRTQNGGNGDWDGTTGTPTYMEITLGGLAAGDYGWTSYHHDTEHCFGDFAVWLSTDGGGTFAQLADGMWTDTSEGGTPDSDLYGYREVGPDVTTLNSAYSTSFTANGTDDVVLRFALYSGTYLHEGNPAVHNQIWGMNGFELVPEPATIMLLGFGSLVIGRRRRK